MTPEQYEDLCSRMDALTGPGDEEINHYLADGILCEALKLNGCDKLVELFDKVNKWYA